MFTRPRTIIAFILCIILLLVMFFHTSFKAYQFARFELDFFYHYEKLAKFLDHLGHDGRRFYLQQHLPVHTAFWLTFAFAYCGILRRLTGQTWPKLWPYIAALPLFSGTFALIETAIIALNISNIMPNILFIAVPAHICSMLWLVATHIMLFILWIMKNKYPFHTDHHQSYHE